MNGLVEGTNTVEPYSEEWFRNRAFNALKPMGNNIWDFSDSLLLYVPGTEEEYESAQQVESPYHQLVTKPERQYLEGIASTIVSELPQEFEYVDLGPGTEHKEQFIFDEAKRQGKKFSYVPVDISNKFLALSSSYASQQEIPTRPERSSFEVLPARMGAPNIPRYVSIGLTYTNYEPKQILELLKSIAGEHGLAFINSQIRDRVDMTEIAKIYGKDVIGIAKGKLKLLGLNFDTDISKLETDDGIRAWCEISRSTPELEKRGVMAGACLLVFQSLRTTKESLEKDVASVFSSHTLLDTGEPFIGVLLKA